MYLLKIKNSLTSILNYLPFFSVTELYLPTLCKLRCFHCEVWKNHALDAFVPKDFYKKTVHLYGGEPTQDVSRLTSLLSRLKLKGSRTHLWTHGLFDENALKSVLTWVDHIHVYFPAPTQETYRNITGEDGFVQFLSCLEFLKEEKKEMSLNFPVRMETLEFLPDVHEFARRYGLDLIIHYHKDASFSKEPLRYIHRYRRIPGVTVYKSTHHAALACAGFPLGALKSPWQIVINLAYSIRSRITSNL